ncbi:type II toxin-antitoxin system HigA family antitoxin [Chitinophagaceae bacterium LWZ2-11]
MNVLLYKIIKTETQYNQYCNELEALLMLKKKSKYQQDLIDLLTLLIEKWDEEHNTFSDVGPVELLRYLMNENNYKSVDLAKTLFISPSLVSDILNYRRSLSKEIIRKLADLFKVSQELFNKPYELLSPAPASKNLRSALTSKKVITQNH